MDRYIETSEFAAFQNDFVSVLRSEFAKNHEQTLTLANSIAALHEDFHGFKHQVQQNFDQVRGEIGQVKDGIKQLKDDVKEIKEFVGMGKHRH